MRALRVLIALFPALVGARPAPAQQLPTPPQRDSLRISLDSLRRDPNGLSLSAESVSVGARTVPAGERVAGDAITWRGDLDVRGTVEGNAVAIGGNVILRSGSTVRGDAVAIGGKVLADGGTVGGEMRALSGLSVGLLGGSRQLTPMQAARRSLSLSVGWYLVLAVIGFGVSLFARANLETIAETISEDFSRAFLYGVLGQLALLPVLVLSIIALAVTLIGIFLIPFAIVALFLAAAGALALGFLAMSYVTGESALRRRELSASFGPPPVLLYLFFGLTLYFALWAVASAFTRAGLLGALLRLVATVVTWVAVTVGFGATLLSRGGTRTHAEPPTAAPPPLEDYSWQTPTPVTGVAAARRPTPAPRQGER